jgi:hypothetical protein
MDWDMIGAVGELLGAVAVVISLLYVARQVRDSSNAAQRAHYLELNREITNFADGIAREDEWSDIVFRGFVDRSSLAPKEILRFNAGVLGIFRSWEAVFHASREDEVLEWGAEGLRSSMVDILGYPGVQAYWADRQHWFSSDFRAEVNLILGSAEPTLLRSYGLDV